MSNLTILTGNIGKGAVRVTPNGKTVCNFSIADQIGYGDNAKTQWIECALWGKRAENPKLTDMLVKGAKVTVRGQVELIEADGQYPAKLKMSFVDDIMHITASQTPNAQSGSAQTAQGGLQGTPSNDFDDDIPF